MKEHPILQLLQQGRIKTALHQMQDKASELRISHLNARIESLLTNYDLLAQYYLAGTEDPERSKLWHSIKKETWSIWHELKEELRIAHSRGFPYSQIRDAQSKRDVVVLDTFQYYQEGICSREAYEDMLKRLFCHLLTTTTLQSADETLYNNILSNSTWGLNEQCLAVTAISLNLWRKWDKAKYMLLVNSLKCGTKEAEVRALCGICFSILLHPHNYTAGDLYNMLMDHPSLNKKIETIIKLIIQTAGTQRLTEKLRTEILPDLMKAGQKMQERLDDAQKEEDFNPNWLENDSEIESRIREFGELQMSGADVYFANFSELKRLSFFQSPHAWFLPFDKRHTAIAELFTGNGKSVLDTFIENGVLCNSDKYSFCLSIKQMPEMQRQVIQSQLGNELEEQMAEGIQKLNADELWMRTANQYIQDLYRFFELFPALSKDYRNPFHSSLDWANTPLFTNGLLSMHQQLTLADKLFSEKYYTHAIAIYKQWEKEIPTASLYQKMGYATEKLSGSGKEALDLYKKADLLQANDKWTLKRMAHIHYTQGDYEASLGLYAEVTKLSPNDPRIEIKMCHCQEALGRLDDALQTAFKLHWEHPPFVPAAIAIGDLSYQIGNYEQAKKYWELSLTMSDHPSDKTLHIGVGLWAIGQRKRAQEILHEGLIQCQKEQRESYYKKVNQVMQKMCKNIDPSDIELFLDLL